MDDINVAMQISCGLYNYFRSYWIEGFHYILTKVKELENQQLNDIVNILETNPHTEYFLSLFLSIFLLYFISCVLELGETIKNYAKRCYQKYQEKGKTNIQEKQPLREVAAENSKKKK